MERKSSKTCVVYFQPPGAVTDTSVLVLNMGYSNKRTKLKITAVTQKESPQVSESLLILRLSAIELKLELEFRTNGN